MASIALHGVTKAYPNGQLAVRDLSLEAADGERLVILGPSGSGKSTVLRLIAGLETPREGRILIDDRDVTALPPQQRDLAMVFQNYALYPHKTVRDHLSFGLRIRHMPAAAIAARVRDVAAMLGLDALLDRKPAQLSGGQRQRVALGRAVVREPKAFLLDEPLSNLDPLLRVSTRTELALLQRRLGTTMVYVTHDQEEAMTLGTRVAVMREGRLAQVAAPMTLFEVPASLFVARFVGSPSMNVWRCRAVEHPSRALVSAGLTVRLDERGPLPDGREVWLGARPHDVELVQGGGDADGTARVMMVEPLGASAVLHVAREGAVADLVRIVVSIDCPARVDTPVSFRLRRDRLHLFDIDTGDRLSG